MAKRALAAATTHEGRTQDAASDQYEWGYPANEQVLFPVTSGRDRLQSGEVTHNPVFREVLRATRQELVAGFLS